jgi:hypothetical protein
LETRSSTLRRRHLGTEFVIVVTAVAGWMLIVLFKPSIIDALLESINRIVLEKTESSSYEERNVWTAVSLQALLDTYGIGVGLGGTRASNSAVAIVSNVGVVGAIFYFGFIIQSLLRGAAPGDTEGKVLVSGLRYAFVPPFLVGLLVGTTPDFGGIGTFQYGLLTAIGLGGLFVSISAASRRAARRGGPMVTAR